MDDFKKANQVDVTAIDYNVPQYVKRCKGDGKKLRKLARTRLKRKIQEEIQNED